MCGFVGYKITDPKPNHQEIIKTMADTIAHRGPDDEGFFVDDKIALGFRRLSIIDLERGGQPIFNEDCSLVLVFNGEIYNFLELRTKLQKAGHVFQTESDSEVLIHGYEEFGDRLPEYLIGMFAFVVWDKKTGALFGARDPFGIKPFYYYHKDAAFLFGSEIKGFLPHPEFTKSLNRKHLSTYLNFEYIPSEETLFENVFKLLGGHCFKFADGRLEIKKYYSVQFAPQTGRSLNEWAKEIDEVLTSSVRRHQISDVEVGCFLSSGVDSSIVAKKVSEEFSGTNTFSSPVKTFSIGYSHSSLSELEDASTFAKAVGLPNHSIVMRDEMFFRDIHSIQYYMDEPLPNPSAIPLFYLAREASEHVKVVLSGEGADELFGGYPLYMAERQFMKYAKLPKTIRKIVAKLADILPDFKGKHFLVAGAQEPYQRYLRKDYVFNNEEIRDILLDGSQVEDPDLFCKRVFDETTDLDAVTQTQYADIHIWMAYDILQKADKMSMANSLELRVPFLDRIVMETAAKIPYPFKTDGKISKIALRKSAESYLPKRTVEMKKKGFPVPLDRLLREETYYTQIKQTFQSESAKQFFSVPKIMRLLDEHKNGAHNMKKVWSIYCFLLWYEEFFVKR